MNFKPNDGLILRKKIRRNGWNRRHIGRLYPWSGWNTGPIGPTQGQPALGYFEPYFTSGALKYFSIGISKYIKSLPFASCTPVR